MRRTFPLALVGIALFASAATAGPFELPPADARPDPKSVQRYGPAYRYPQAGWVVLHVEGEPYERGYQHGRLMAPEIAAYVRCFAALQSPKAPADGWRLTRTLVNGLFLRKFDREYLEEMKGIADGAAAAGARFDNRPVDLTDLAKQFKTVAKFGPPLDRAWKPTQEQLTDFPEIRPLVSNPVTILHANQPPAAKDGEAKAADLSDRVARGGQGEDRAARGRGRFGGPTVPAWHGTVLPKADADVWLAAAPRRTSASPPG